MSRNELLGTRAVDRVFRQAPILEAPPGFADRVMAAVAVAPVKRHRRFPWLVLVAFIALVGGTLVLAQGPGPLTLGILVQQAVNWLISAGNRAGDLLVVMAGPLVTLAAIALTALILVLWSALMVSTNTHRQQVVYRVPVRFH